MDSSRYEMELKRCNVVLVASAHNPSILTQQWLAEYCGLVDEPKKAVCTPEFSLFEGSRVQITNDHSRMQIMALEFTQEVLGLVVQVGKRYIEALPHIPYKAIGLNYVWNVEWSNAAELELALTVNGQVTDSIPGYNTLFGASILGWAEDHQLQLKCDPASETKITASFNYHYEASGEGIDYLTQRVDLLPEQIEHSKQVLQRVLKIEEAQDG